MTVKDTLDDNTLAFVKEAVEKIKASELTLEEAAEAYSIDEAILSAFVEESVQGENLQDAPKKSGYDDGSEENENPKVEGADELKNGSKGSKKGTVKEDVDLTDEEVAELEEEFGATSDDDLFEAFVTPGMQKYKAAKALIARLKAKNKDGNLSPEDGKKLQQAISYVSSTDRAGFAKKNSGKTPEQVAKDKKKANFATGSRLKEDNELELQTKVSKEDIAIDVKEHLDAFFKGEELSEDFKEKVKNIFETAIVETSQKIISANVAKLEENLQEQVEAKIAQLEESTEEYKEGLNQKVDEYLSYVVEEWVAENKPAVQSTIRSDLTESFLVGLKELFEEHYIDIPEEKANIVEDYAKKLEESENEITTLTEQVIALRKEKTQIIKTNIVEKVSVGLSENEKERFMSLTENVEYRNDENFEKAISDIKDSYFEESAPQVSGVEGDDTPLENIEEAAKPTVEAKEVPFEVASVADYLRRAQKLR